ncbi:helix-turn-helix domain-containing protein (plasmid) [Embleya sp. NBC_00888]|uniref:helix-turn-helix domain-containing protein n=1 Tax=Embleya sp. NBC_00888 TaxID=2975960 RepID=UPI002F911D5E|nr:helix-turn-helix domain-containing protein [Embleya sp. NBC_00888]
MSWTVGRSLGQAADTPDAQSGGPAPKERAARERLRLNAAERFERGEPNAVIASESRVARRSVQRWHRAWREAGVQGLRSAGPASSPRTSPPISSRRRGGRSSTGHDRSCMRAEPSRITFFVSVRPRGFR